MKILLTKLSCSLLCLLLTVACAHHVANPDSNNAIYYWRTTFTLNDAERDFIKTHNIKRLYVHFFDVVYNNEPVYGEYLVPEATIQFIDSIPAGLEVVPTIYITTGAMEKMQQNEHEYAEKILKRIKAICRRYNIEFNEIQLDCDWTNGTRPHFFKLCEEMKQCIAPDRMLSSTIRLHQLVQTPPPVDKGVLMVYNTGSFKSISSKNSIFNPADIEPYLKDDRLKKYTLPLDVAWPAYGWSVAFDQDNKFVGLLHTTDLRNMKGLGVLRDGRHNISDYNFIDGRLLAPGSHIRVERPSAKEVAAIKKLINQQLGTEHANIIYHLDSEQLKNYSHNEIENIFAAN